MVVDSPEGLSRTRDLPGLQVPKRSARARRTATYKSARASQISMLALAETGAAVLLTVATAFLTDWRLLAVSSCVAPLFLLRTPLSERRGLRVAVGAKRTLGSKIVRPLLDLCVSLRAGDANSQSRSGVAAVAGVGVEVLAGAVFLIRGLTHVAAALVGRLVSTVWTTVEHPVRAVRAIEGNWWRIVACVDSFVPVELVPGASTDWATRKYPIDRLSFLPAKRLRLSRILVGAPRSDRATRALALVMVVPSLALGITFRFTVKGTALLYWPITWISRAGTRDAPATLAAEVCESARQRVGRVLAGAAVLVLGGKLILLATLSRLTPDLNARLGEEFTALVVAPASFPRWQAASLFNGVLAFMAYFMADRIQRRTRSSGVPLGRFYVGGFRCVLLARAVLSLYAVLAMVALAIAMSPFVELGDEWIPS